MQRPVDWIDDPRSVAELGERLLRTDVVALDTEQDSFFAYTPKICLVQIALPDRDLLIDPLAVADLSPLGEALSDPRRTVVLHAGENDVHLLRKQFGLEIRGLFDTMAAAWVLGYPRTGLAGLLEEHFGLRLDKKHQRSDWRRRPLTPQQIEYAALDVRHLAPLRDVLAAELERKGRTAEAESEFRRIERTEHEERPFDPEGWVRIRGARELTGAGRSVLRELYLWRDRVARAEDRAPFRVLGNAQLLDLARRRPRSSESLARVRGVPASTLRRFGGDLLRTVRKGIERGPIGLPRRPSRGVRGRGEPRLKPVEEQRLERLRRWREERSRRRGVDPGRVVPSALLRRLARERPRTPEDLRRAGFEEWRVAEYGDDILRILGVE